MNNESLALRWGRGILAVLCAAGVSVPVAAQGPAVGSMRGVVGDAGQRVAVREALVTATDRETGLQRSIFTDRAGRFELGQLPPGEYDLLVERLGFPPLRLPGLVVRPGRATNVDLQLTPTEDPGIERRVQAGGLPGTSQWIPSFALHSLPGLRGELDEWLRLSTWADERGGLEGLPSWLSTWAMDGAPFRPARHVVLSDLGGSIAFPVQGVGSAEVVGNAFDVEWGSAGGTVSAHRRRGSSASTGAAAAGFSSSVLSAGGVVDAGSLDYQDVIGSAVLRGAALSDSARYAIGGVLRSWDMPRTALWAAGEAATQLASAGQSRGLALGSYAEASLQPMDAFAGFGALDWSVAPSHRLALTVNAGTSPEQDLVLASTGAMTASARDIVAQGTLRSVMESGMRNTLSISGSSTSRETFAADAPRATLLVPGDLRLGSGAAATSEESQLRVLDAIELGAGAHSLKLGAELAFSRYDYAFRRNGGGSYLFGGIAELQAGTGVFSRTVGPAPSGSWSAPRYSAFVQDRWRDGRGIEVVVGAKVSYEKLDPGVRRDLGWLNLSGIANDTTDAKAWTVSPRAAVIWDVEQRQEWLLHLAAGVYHDRIDPLLIAEWKLDDGTTEAVRAVGNVGAQWPNGEPSATSRARRLTVLGPDFAGPRTTRMSAGVARQLESGTRLELDASYRETRNLPRRADLNLLPAAGARDGAGRGVFGQLVQQGGLLAATPTSSRRFIEYDEVAALNVDGWSRFWGATLTAEHQVASGLSLLARYTWSQTTDNWFGAAAGGGWGIVVPQSLGDREDWAKGTSDFDLPHRLAVGAAFDAPLGVRVSALYRWQSGHPFTPGYPAGVDANGDGTAGNDPAFVDPAVEGTSALFNDWSCLRDRSGRLAERNGCRGDAAQTLDLQLSARVLRFGRGNLSVRAELLDVFEADFSTPDAALYLVNPNGSVQRDEVARSITLPLMINPDFGTPLDRGRPGRLLRLGAAVTW